MKFLRVLPLLPLIFLVPAAPVFAEAPAAAPTVAAVKLGSAVFKWEDLKVTPTGVGQRRDVVEQPTATLEKFECHVSTLNPGQMSHPPHRHAQEEFIIIKEGSLEVSINGKSQHVGAGSLFFFASNDLHNVRNVGEIPATYLVFNLTTAATHSVPDKSAAEIARPGTLGSTIFEWASMEPKPIEVGFRRAIIEKPTLTCTTFEGHITTLNAGSTSHATHRHPDEELLVMKEGVLDVTIAGVTQRVGPGSICFFASNDEHGVKTVGPAPSTYYAIRFTTAATPHSGAM